MKQEIERITVLVRAIPQVRKEHGYLVYIAGINEKREFRRVYPFEFSYGEKSIDIKKKDRIEVAVTLPDDDQRKESRKKINCKNLHSPAKEEEIRALLRSRVSSVEKLTEEGASLGVIKPDLLGVKIKVNSTEIYDRQQYLNLMGDFIVEEKEKARMPVELRYNFKCKSDPLCKGHQIILLDWEFNEFARNIMRTDRDPTSIEGKIRNRFFDFVKERDLYFIMGTHLSFKDWMILGIFYPEKKEEKQKKLLEF